MEPFCEWQESYHAVWKTFTSTSAFGFFQMEFAVHDINKDVLEITVFDKDLFSPNGKNQNQLKSHDSQL